MKHIWSTLTATLEQT